MILVLTYHRIIEDKSGFGGFFDVSAADLDKHLRHAKALWGEISSPRALLGCASTGCASTENKVFVTFDDGTADHYLNAAPILESNGARGIFFVSTNLIGTNGCLTLAQCQELEERGHAIESHSHDHTKLHRLDRRSVRYQLTESRRRLQGLGLGNLNLHAMPGGYYNDIVIEEAKAAGYDYLRTIEWGYNRVFDPFQIESIIINQKTSGRLFDLLISPRFEGTKKLLFRGKELLKSGGMRSVYTRLRDLGHSR